MFELSEAALAGLAGLAGGVLLGLAARFGRFCTLGAIEDWIYARDQRRGRMWGVALAVAIGGVAILDHLGAVALEKSVYNRYVWNPWASVFGGALFGYGMALAGNCGYGALARAAGGEIRSVVILIVLGVSAYAALAGPLAPLRLALFPVERVATPEVRGAAHDIAGLTGLAPVLVAGALALALLAWALACRALRAAPALIAWAAVVGVAIVSGWWATSHLAITGFGAVPPESHSFTAPLGQALLYLMTSSVGAIDFSVGSVAGVLIGGVAAALYQRQFRWDACDDPRELGRQMLGGALMGIGGVIAVGCSVGQGLTAFSALAWSAPVVAASIVAGAALGLKHLIEGFPSPAKLILRLSRRRL